MNQLNIDVENFAVRLSTLREQIRFLHFTAMEDLPPSQSADFLIAGLDGLIDVIEARQNDFALLADKLSASERRQPSEAQ